MNKKNMKGINIWNADSFEKETNSNLIRVEALFRKFWVKARPIGFWSLKHRFHCALEVFKGKADIIYFYKQ